ncbi:MAG TPA: ATP-binding protein [Candidatus Limnocylindrales bacterium]
MEEAVSGKKQDDSVCRYRVSTQSARHVGANLRRRLRAAALPLCCVAFLSSAAIALALPPNPIPKLGGIVVDDSSGVVISVDPASGAWDMGVRAGWYRVAEVEGMTDYSDGSQVRVVADHYYSPQSGIDLLLTSPFIVLGLAGLLAAARQRRTGLTIAVGSATMASWIWVGHLGVIGQAMAVLPIGLASGLPLQFGSQLRIGPWRSRSIPARARAAMAGVAVISAVGVAAVAVAWGLLFGVAVGVLFYTALAWLIVVRWRVVSVATGQGSHSRLAIARAVAFDMLPYSDRVRRRGAQAERDRLASDLHAEVLPAIATAAAALEQKGQSEEAERLRELASSVRDLVSDRRLPILSDFGLVSAAEWLAESLQARANLDIEIDLDGDNGDRRPPAVEAAAYRVMQLALDNVMRHARATSAQVAIAGDAQSLVLTISDDGLGIDAAASVRAVRGGHLGLKDMRTEAEAVGATIEIGPGSPRGTVVVLGWHG